MPSHRHAARARRTAPQSPRIVGLLSILVPVLVAAPVARAQTPPPYTNFEGSQTNPIRLSPDGTRLFAVNTPDARLSVFDVTRAPAAPRLMAEIPVGVEPVSCNARTADEVWVVNQVSDSVSIVSVSRGIVTNTLQVKDDPADVVFAGGRAFVSVAGSNQVRVFDATTLSALASINLVGNSPRAMAVSADGNKVYVAFAMSGNRTTIIPANLAPPQPPPTNTNLPAPPQVGLIVDATNTQWNPSVIKYTMPDNDVAEIDVQSMTVTRYFSHLGTINLALAVRPTTGDLFVANTDARNLTRFEPNVKGHIVENRLTMVTPSGAVTQIDLNAGINYAILPNSNARAIAIAQPTSVAFDSTGQFMYVASFGTDRIGKVSATNGQVVGRIEVGPPAGQGSNADPRNKRGPRGLAYSGGSQSLYVLNRISNTLMTINTATDSVVNERPVGAYDPTPPVIRQGRGFLYDAKLSGSGTAACAACHIDGDNDRIAWDLGDPGGQMATVNGTTLGGIPQTFQFHPMKGPMTTQTLRGLDTTQPFHWRADRADFTAFNPAFASLMGGTPLSTDDMNAYAAFISTVKYPPNPNQTLDRGMPATLDGGDPNAGRNTYINEFYAQGIHCNDCHTATNNGTGTNRTIIPAIALNESQAFKVPQLRNAYAKTYFNNTPGAVSIDGFGFTHDGTDPTLQVFLSRAAFPLIRNDTVRKNNLAAFVKCFDTGTAPAVGYTRTVRPENYNDPTITSDWGTLESQAAAGNCDLIVKGSLFGGRVHGLVYRPATGVYETDSSLVGPQTRPALTTRAQLGEIMTVMGVPRGSGVRMGIDRNLDGIPDGSIIVKAAPETPQEQPLDPTVLSSQTQLSP